MPSKLPLFYERKCENYALPVISNMADMQRFNKRWCFNIKNYSFHEF